jgi:hypothetical protein
MLCIIGGRIHTEGSYAEHYGWEDKMGRKLGRRGFLEAFGSTILGVIGGALGARSAIARTSGVFAGRFLEDSHVMSVPPGEYDPEKKMFINSENGEPAFLKRQAMSSSQTPCTYSTCRAYDSGGNCTQYDSDRCTPTLDWD